MVKFGFKLQQENEKKKNIKKYFFLYLIHEKWEIKLNIIKILYVFKLFNFYLKKEMSLKLYVKIIY